MMNDKLSATQVAKKSKNTRSEFSIEANNMDYIHIAIIAALEAYNDDYKQLRLPK